MKKLIIALIVGSLSSVSGFAAEKETKGAEAKEITAVGEVICAHCDLKVGKSCQEAIKTKDGKSFILAGEKVKAFFKANKNAKTVKATGTTRKEGAYSVLTASKITEVKVKVKKGAAKKAS